MVDSALTILQADEKCPKCLFYQLFHHQSFVGIVPSRVIFLITNLFLFVVISHHVYLQPIVADVMIVSLKAVLETEYDEIMAAIAVLFPIFHENEDEEKNEDIDVPWGNGCGEFYTEADRFASQFEPPFQVGYDMKIKYLLYKSWYLHTVMILNPMRCAQESRSEAAWMNDFVLVSIPDKIKFLKCVHQESERLVGLLGGRHPNNAFRMWLHNEGRLNKDVNAVVTMHQVSTHCCEDCLDSPAPDNDCLGAIAKLLSIMHDGHIVMDLTS